MQFAAFENSNTVSKNEINIASHVAIAKVLTRRNTRSIVSITIATSRKQRVLCTQYSKVAEDRAVSGNRQRHRLALAASCIVGNRHGGDAVIIRLYKHGRTVECPSITRTGFVEDDPGFFRVRVFAMEIHMVLTNGYNLAVDARSYPNLTPGSRQCLDRLLNR